MKKVSILIKDTSMQYEGLRTSLGLLLEDMDVRMFVLDNEIASMDEAYSDNLGFLEEMGGSYYSNNAINISKYGFRPIDSEAIWYKISTSDIIIPF